MKKNSFVYALLLSTCFAFSSQAGTAGAQHNRLLDCMRRLDPQNRMNVQQVFESLVTRCRFNPGMPTGEWLRQFVPLVPRQLQGGTAGASLAEMLAPYESKFNSQQMGFLRKANEILSGQSGDAVARQLAQLYRDASQALGSSQLDQAVVNGLDIGASSAMYWGGGHRPSPTDPTMQVKWWHVVAADVAGGIVGGVFGGGVGAVGLGVGCSKLVAAL